MTLNETQPTLRLHSSRFVIESCDVFVGNRTLFEVFGNIQQFENRMKAFDPQCIALGILSTLESSLPFAQKPLLGFNDFFLTGALCLSAGRGVLRLTRLPRHDRGPVPGGNRSAASCPCTVLRRASYTPWFCCYS